MSPPPPPSREARNLRQPHGFHELPRTQTVPTPSSGWSSSPELAHGGAMSYDGRGDWSTCSTASKWRGPGNVQELSHLARQTVGHSRPRPFRLPRGEAYMLQIAIHGEHVRIWTIINMTLSILFFCTPSSCGITGASGAPTFIPPPPDKRKSQRRRGHRRSLYMRGTRE